MCGIAGALSVDEPIPVLESMVWGIVRSQHQRGPDHQAVVHQAMQQCNIALGHNRLSIIDLSSAAHQPMWDAEQQYLITYNGEIYNYLELKQELAGLGHSFTTQSDTEVILEAFKAWGVEAFNHFNGMFAFALLDARAGKVWLVRDRFGVKPLCYSFNERTLVFASTASPIARQFHYKPNLAYLSKGIGYLIYDDDSGNTPYEGVHALRAGHYLEVCWGQARIRSQPTEYYNLTQRVLDKREQLLGLKEAQLLEQLEQTLTTAVRFRLRADVPVAVSLSGGLDSSTVSVLAAGEHPRITGFSFAHPDAPESEGPLVRQLEQQADINVHYIWPKLTSTELERLFYSTLFAQDAPFSTTSIMAQNLVYGAAHQHGFKVLLGGQGGDESFMGYRKFQVFYLRYLIHTQQFGLAIPFALYFAKMLVAELPQAGLYWSQRRRYSSAQAQSPRLSLPPAQLKLSPNPSDPPWQRQSDDICRYSLPTLLRYEDRNSMGHSIESRLPFLDYRLIELGLALPETLKLRYGYGKWALRGLMRSRLPRDIWASPYKRGFDVQQDWISSGLGQIIRNALQDNHSTTRTYLRPNVAIGDAYGDERLVQDRTALREAIALVWLCTHSAKSTWPQ